MNIQYLGTGGLNDPLVAVNDGFNIIILIEETVSNGLKVIIWNKTINHASLPERFLESGSLNYHIPCFQLSETRGYIMWAYLNNLFKTFFFFLFFINAQ